MRLTCMSKRWSEKKATALLSKMMLWPIGYLKCKVNFEYRVLYKTKQYCIKMFRTVYTMNVDKRQASTLLTEPVLRL